MHAHAAYLINLVDPSLPALSQDNHHALRLPHSVLTTDESLKGPGTLYVHSSGQVSLIKVGSVHSCANYGGRVGWSSSPAGTLRPAGCRKVLAARIVCYEQRS